MADDYERKYEEAKAELDRVIESGGTMEELEQFIERSWGKTEMMAAIAALLLQEQGEDG